MPEAIAIALYVLGLLNMWATVNAASGYRRMDAYKMFVILGWPIVMLGCLFSLVAASIRAAVILMHCVLLDWRKKKEASV